MGELCPLFLLSMIDKIREIITSALQEEGVELVEIIYRPEAAGKVLRLLVDKDGGITIADCACLNDKISQVLDQADIIQERYSLEVDSPGIDRPFKIKRDYERAKGRYVRVTLKEAVLDKKEYIGILEEILENSIKVSTQKKGILEIQFDNIVRARQEVAF
ncbi:MAG: ribosome maturation factor RimP [Candidatus Omnitrophota bacterium]